MTTPILELNEVVKSYSQHLAVNKVSFEVPRGSIFGLLGPNGAGKTSLIRIITTIIRADSGTILLDGEPLNSRHPEQIGYMPEERGLYKKMKVGEHLVYLARLKGLSKTAAEEAIEYWIKRFDIADWMPKKIQELSKGMQQKIQFIATVLHNPKLLILDEPFSGLDPINTNLLKEEIYQLHQNGTSIIFSTHRMEQVEEICEYIALINKGEKVLEGLVKGIKQQFKENLFRVDFEGPLPEFLEEQVKIIQRKPESLTVQLPDGQESNVFLKLLLEQGVKINAFQEILPSLNEIFIKAIQ